MTSEPAIDEVGLMSQTRRTNQRMIFTQQPQQLGQRPRRLHAISERSPRRGANLIHDTRFMHRPRIVIHQARGQRIAGVVDKKDTAGSAVHSHTPNGRGGQVINRCTAGRYRGAPPLFGILFVTRTVPLRSEWMRALPNQKTIAGNCGCANALGAKINAEPAAFIPWATVHNAIFVSGGLQVGKRRRETRISGRSAKRSQCQDRLRPFRRPLLKNLAKAE
jgi:hypothetical protein